MGDRLERLRRECPTQWAPDRTELETRMAHLKKKWEEVWENVSPAEVGGQTAAFFKRTITASL